MKAGDAGGGLGTTASTATPAALTLLALCAVFFCVWIVWRAFIPLEIDRNEAWNAWHAMDVARGIALYPGADALVGNNYPPLSFLVLGGLARLGLDPLLAGRLLSLAALLMASAAAGTCLQVLGAGRTGALAGALWYVAMMARFQARYVGMDDPNLPALALMAVGLAVFLQALRRDRVPYGGLALMVVAGFIKHNLVALPLAALAWNGLSQRSTLMRSVMFSALATGAGLLACHFAFGAVFWQQLSSPRTFSPGRAASSLGWLLQNLAPALLLWGLWALRRRASAAMQFSALLLATTFGLNFLVKMGAGVDDNAYFEAALASAIGLGLAVDGAVDAALPRGVAARHRRAAMIVFAVACLFASDHIEPMLFFNPAFRAEIKQRVQVLERESARIRALPGAVSCSVLSVCYRAGKAFAYDRYTLTQRVATGRWSAQQLAAAVQREAIRFEEVDPRTRWRSDEWTLGGPGPARLQPDPLP